MHAEALTETGAALFQRLRRFAGFYLVGGTALALQIGHRRSIDFDLFTRATLSPRLLQQVKRIFRESSVIVTYRAPGQLNVTVENVNMTFFEYAYPVLDRFVEYRGVPIASVREIAAMKAFSLGKRLSYKDYVDWYFLLSEKRVTLPVVMSFAKRKFGHDFNDRLFLGQLASFDDVKSVPIDFLRDPVDRRALQHFLEKAVRSFKI